MDNRIDCLAVTVSFVTYQGRECQGMSRLMIFLALFPYTTKTLALAIRQFQDVVILKRVKIIYFIDFVKFALTLFFALIGECVN